MQPIGGEVVLGAGIGRRFSALRQIRHVGRLAVAFPQDAELAMLDLPEADPAGPIAGKGSIFHALYGLANSLP